VSTSQNFTLKVECPGRTGLVAGISGFLSEHNLFIVEMKQFDDEVSGRFFAVLNSRRIILST
jgi:formyltetrahydrofolate deformylase